MKIQGALLGLHSFSGNDYISSFWRNGKPAFWKLVKGEEEFQKTFAELVKKIVRVVICYLAWKSLFAICMERNDCC